MDEITLYQAPTNTQLDVAIFACGCFWGAQHLFGKQQGVVRTLAGYTGGQEAFPTYQQVKAHLTHHVEAVVVEYNPQHVSYEELCKLFFEIHDPSQTDGIGPDLGPQYRSEIFYPDEEQKRQASAVIDLLRQKRYEVNTRLTPATVFWEAEDYHQHYYDKTGEAPYCHIRVKKF